MQALNLDNSRGVPWQNRYSVKYCLLALLVLLGLLVPMSSLGEVSELHRSTSQKATQLYNEAARHYIKKEYTEAISLLEQALKKDKKFIPAYLHLATIYQQLDEPERSIELLKKAYSYLSADKPAAFYYEIAQLYYRLGSYEPAKAVLQALTIQKDLPQSLATKIHTLEQHLQFALEKIQHPVSFNPRKLPLPLNQFLAQYFPVLTVDQQSLIFTAYTKQEDQFRENLYISHKDEAGNWSTPVSISEQINSSTSNEGTCTISADKKTLVFTSCARAGNYGTCDLYISYQHEGVWSTPQNLGPNINSAGWQSQPSLSADGKTLYFVSERPGNQGKKDIWQSTLQDDGQWSKAINLDAPINSPYQQISPFIHPNGQTLFFASDRVPSMGGFDIYYSNFMNGQWTTPTNLGYPINNHQDQVSLFITADGKKAYYAGGKHQGTHYYNSYLYELDMPEDLVVMPKSDFVKLQILDANTQKPLSAQIEVYEVSSDSCQRTVQVDEFDGETILVVNEGQEYLIYINKDGYLFESIKVAYTQKDKAVITPQGAVMLKPISVDQSKILQNIYFGFDDYNIEDRSILELKRLVAFLQANPQINIELEGHTDYVGPASYNATLSINRAKAIYDYLIAAGISATRLTYKGYGPERPLVPNDMPANRQLNRRVAFRITQIHT